MTPEEVQKTFEELKSEGMDDNAILVALGKMFQNGDITKDQLGAFIHQLGYEFTPEFAEKSEEDAKSSVLENPDEGEGGEGSPEPEDSNSPDDSADEGDGEGDEEEGDDEESERRKAMSLFGR